MSKKWKRKLENSLSDEERQWKRNQHLLLLVVAVDLIVVVDTNKLASSFESHFYQK